MACFLERDDYICHVLQMKKWDADYARSALIWYDKALPWLELMEGVRDALKHESSRGPQVDRKAGGMA